MTLEFRENGPRTDASEASGAGQRAAPDGDARPVNLLVIDGDGTSTELVNATLLVLRKLGALTGLDFRFEMQRVGLQTLDEVGTTFPAAVLEAARAADGVILGPVSHNDYPAASQGGLNPSGQLRQQLDLYANIRPAKSHAGVPMRLPGSIDLVVVRENTEGFYSDRSMYLGPGEFMPTADVAMSFRKITRGGSMRIAECAFGLALRRRRKVTAVHKANVLRVTDGLFLDCVRQVAKAYPEVEYEEQLIDAMTALARAGFAHGDLSPYNLLVHHGRLVMIDLPQIVDVISHPNGRGFLERDAKNVAIWFARAGHPEADPELLAHLLAKEARLALPSYRSNSDDR